jgi:peptidoglycan/xylan/chitin deacetylase (PgdA/CDA1 family)
MRGRLFLVSLGAALAVLASSAGATSSTPQPPEIVTSTVVQAGAELSWSVTLARPFSPRALARSGRSLCLLIEARSGGQVVAQVCVARPRRGGRSPRLTAAPGPPGPRPTNFHFIPATISRSGTSELTAVFDPASIGIGYRATYWQVLSRVRAHGCAPAAGQGNVCERFFPSQPAVAKLHVPKLVGCVPSGAPFVTRGPTNQGKEIALTFDDGPWLLTSRFLDVLERYHVPATFFEIGDQISEYGEGGAIERRMLADGDMIGDHTWNHPNVSGGGAFARGQIARASAAIKAATDGFEPCLFRAPYGDVSPALFSVAESLGFKTIQWDIDPRDWARPGVAAIYDNVLANAHPGAIVIQHDGGGDRTETLAALPIEIRALERRGYRFVTITQLFGMRLLYR